MSNNRKSRVEKRKATQPKRKFTWKKLMKYALLACLLIGITGASIFAYFIATAPKIDVDKLDVPFASELLDQNGDRFASLYDENRRKIEYDDLPQELIDAVIATEDVRFFEHKGIDLRRIGGAIVANFKRGFGAEGASTITQQVVENMFLTPDKNIKLKVQEQWLALQLERKFSKEEILEMYLNKIFYGSNAYGVGKAAEVYFGVTDLHELTLTQSAMLAGLPQRPTAYNPFENPDLMEGRVDTVLKLMVRHGKISEEEAEEARSVDIASQLTDDKPQGVPYEAFIQQVKKEVEEKLDGADINTDGLKIHTTLDTDIQDHVEFLLTDSDENPITYPDETLQAGLTMLDTKTGAIQAIGGSRNRENVDGMNYAIDIERQAGSTYKPLLAYAPAIESEKWSTYHQILDEPYTPAGSNEIRNVTRENYGWVSARYALTHSLNIPAAKTLEELGSDVVKPFAESIGLTFNENPLNPRDAIGGTDNGTNPLELAGAFRAFGNEGIYNEPFAVTKVEFPDGKEVDLTPDSSAVMEDYTAYMVTDMLKDVISEGTGQSAQISGLPAAGKTGTTNESKDVWFVGYTTNYTLSVWTGDPANKESVSDNTLARNLYKNIMSEASKDIETADFERPDTVVEVGVEKGSNPPELPSDFTPSGNIVKELFVKGTEPSAVSESFDQLDPVSDLTGSYDEDNNEIKVNWSYDEEDDIEFIVNYATDDGSMKQLTQTDDKEITLEDVDAGTSYTFEVIVIQTDSDMKSDAKTTSVKVPDEDDEELPAVSQLNARFEESSRSIQVTWDYNGPPAQFEVDVNGQTEIVDARQLTISDVRDDTTYSITVTPVDDDIRGESKNTKVTVQFSNDDNNNDEDDDNQNNDDNNDINNDNDENNTNNNEDNNNDANDNINASNEE